LRLSIIVPVLNEAANVTRLLTQLQPGRVVRHEVILVDGGSRDATVDVGAPLVDRLVTTATPGRALQMNAGAEVARGSLLWFVHADSVIPANACELVHSLPDDCWGRFDVRLSNPGLAYRVIARCMNIRSRLTGIATGDQGIFVGAQVFRQIGGYPLQPLMEDIEISRRLRQTGKPVCLHEKLQTSSRRWERGGICRTVLLMWRLRLMYFLGASPARLAALYRSA
jgi:rSAM/selenodomain-associated transferase 2